MPRQSNLIRFILIFPNLPTSGKFILKDLPGSGKRIDILCRCLDACFKWGPNILNNNTLEIVAILSNELSLTFTSHKDMPLGEVGWAKEISNVLQEGSCPFISKTYENLDTLVKRIRRISDIWVMDEEGVSFKGILNRISHSQNSFMLGNNRGFDSYAYEVIKKYQIPSMSLGDTSYLGSHCIALVIAQLERLIT